MSRCSRILPHPLLPRISFYLLLLLIGAGLWWSAAILFRFVREYDGETAGGANALREAWESLKLLRDDRPFRHFVITRSLLLCSALSAPFFVVLAQRSASDSKTYLVDMAGGTKRADYVSVSNSVIGVLLLVTGGVSALATLISVEAVLVLLGFSGIAGTISALRLEDV